MSMVVPEFPHPKVNNFVTQVLKHYEEVKTIGGMHHAVNLGERAQSTLPNRRANPERR